MAPSSPRREKNEKSRTFVDETTGRTYTFIDTRKNEMDALNDSSVMAEWGSLLTHCIVCGINNSELRGTLIHCARCKVANYCGPLCMNRDMMAHSKVCMEWKEQRISGELDIEELFPSHVQAELRKTRSASALSPFSRSPIQSTRSSATIDCTPRTPKTLQRKKAEAILHLSPDNSENSDSEFDSSPPAAEAPTPTTSSMSLNTTSSGSTFPSTAPKTPKTTKKKASSLLLTAAPKTPKTPKKKSASSSLLLAAPKTPKTPYSDLPVKTPTKKASYYSSPAKTPGFLCATTTPAAKTPKKVLRVSSAAAVLDVDDKKKKKKDAKKAAALLEKKSASCEELLIINNNGDKTQQNGNSKDEEEEEKSPLPPTTITTTTREAAKTAIASKLDDLKQLHHQKEHAAPLPFMDVSDHTQEPDDKQIEPQRSSPHKNKWNSRSPVSSTSVASAEAQNHQPTSKLNKPYPKPSAACKTPVSGLSTPNKLSITNLFETTSNQSKDDVNVGKIELPDLEYEKKVQKVQIQTKKLKIPGAFANASLPAAFAATKSPTKRPPLNSYRGKTSSSSWRKDSSTLSPKAVSPNSKLAST